MIIYGKNVIREALYKNRPIISLWIDENFSDYKFLNLLEDKNIKYIKTSKHELSSLAQNKTHQGIVAKIKPYETYSLDDVLDENQKQRFIILDSIEDPNNLGAIMRTAEATNMDAIIMRKIGQAQLNATVAKVSSGAIEHVKVILVTNINQAILKLKKHNVFVVGTDGNTNHTYEDIPLNHSLAIVLGNEGEGIRTLIKRNCDMLVKIPMYGKINSLNVSVAAALMMYKIIK